MQYRKWKKQWKIIKKTWIENKWVRKGIVKASEENIIERDIKKAIIG
jgi:hypothetical protein